MDKKKLLWCVSLWVTYAISCWAWYESGKCKGAIEAYNDCYDELEKSDAEILKEFYPDEFKAVEKK